MSAKLVDQQWFFEAVNPTEMEIAIINEKSDEIISRANARAVNGIVRQEDIIAIAKDILGR